MELKDYLNSKDIVLYLKELPQEQTIDQALFPVKKQMGTSIEYAKGSKKKPVALKMSTFDVAAKVRALSAELSVFKKEMPYFKEAMGINETSRRELINAMSANNINLVNALVGQVFENYAALRDAASISMKRMRTQLIQNGEINILTDEGDIVVDYGVPATHKETITTAAKKWNVYTADIVGDLKRWQKALTKEHYAKPNILLMTEATFDSTVMVNTAITDDLYSGYTGTKPILAQEDYINFLKKKLGITVVFLEDTVFYPEEGAEPQSYYEDGKVTFMSGSTLGNTVYGVTPEEYDKSFGTGKLDTSIVDTAVAVTTMVKDDPVSVDVKVSLLGMPSFDRADECFFATVY